MEFEKKSFLDFPGLQTYDSKIKEHIKNLDNVKYTEQELAEEQQMQARKNLGLYYTDRVKLLTLENVTANAGFTPTEPFTLEEGKTYVIRAKGVSGTVIEQEYVCESYSWSAPPYGGPWTDRHLGISYTTTSNPTENIGISYYWYDSNPSDILGYRVNIGTNTDIPYTITVYEAENDVIVPIEEEYIPDSISRNAVEYIEQELTEVQQMQARKNLGLYRTEDNKTLWYNFENVTKNGTSFTIDDIFLEEGKIYTVRTEDADSNIVEEMVWECVKQDWGNEQVEYYLHASVRSPGARYTRVCQMYGVDGTNKWVGTATIPTYDSTGPFTVTIYEGTDVIIPIEEQYIPESVKNDIVNVKTDIENIKNDVADIDENTIKHIEQELTVEQQVQARKNLGLYYKEEIKLCTIENVESSGDFTPTEPFTLEVGKNYIIRAVSASGSVIEKEWTCKQTSWGSGTNGYTSLYLGYAKNISNLNEDIGVSYYWKNGSQSTTTAYYVNILGSTDVPYTITVYQDINTKTIEEEFIPDSIKNSVKYDQQELTEKQQSQARQNIGATVISEEEFCQFVDIKSNGFTNITTIEDNTLTVDNKYKVRIENADGINEFEYICKFSSVPTVSYTNYYCVGGYLSKATSSNIYVYNTEDGVLIFQKSASTGGAIANPNLKTIYIDSSKITLPCTVTVYEFVEVFDEEFIPNTIARIVDIPVVTQQIQADWKQNDESAIDYIKNRTHWIDSETETTVYYDNLTFDLIVDNNTAPEIIDENVKSIDTSKEVTVIWDNVEYNLIPTKPESASLYGIGNWGLVDSTLYEYTTVPFLIQLQEDLPYHMWLNPTSGTEHTISMYQSEEKEVFHQLDENFIPDTIQRVADNIGKPGTGSNSEIFNDYIGNTAEGSYSHAEGYSTDAIGNFSHAENYCTTVEGYGAHAEGGFTKANGEYSHAEGNGTIAQGPNSHAEGNNTTAFGENSHAEGNSTNNALTIISDLSIDQDVLTAWETQKFSLAKNNSHTEGRDNLALGKNSHAEGSFTQALSEEAHAEGNQTVASGWFSHAEGSQTIASGDASHAEGMKAEASGRYSHAEGSGTIVSGAYSHVEGNNTIAVSNNQHVQGKNNISDADEEGNALNTYAHIVGNGLSPMKRSNAHTLDWNGNAWFQGDVYVGSTSGTNKDEGSKKLATEEYVDNIINSGTGAVIPDWEQNDESAGDYIKNRTHYMDVGTVTPYENYEIDCTEAPQSSLGTSYQTGIGYLSSESFKIDYVENKEYSITFDNTIYNCVATKTYLNQSAQATLIGNGALLTSFCEDNGMPFCFAYRATSDGVWYTAVSTQEVHTITISYEDDIVVQLDEKYIPNTIQRTEDAIGRTGIGQQSEIFNNYTYNTATGRCAHAEGHYTIASGDDQHVQGRFNIEDTNNTYAHIVGNGQAPFTEMRSNAHTLDWNGNGWYAGNLYVGGTSQEDATRVATIADLYPVGAIYLSTVETSPASFFGGTWEQIKDTFLLAAGDTYTAGTIGGSATHTLSIDELATHSHGVKTDIDSSEFNIEWPPYTEYTYGWTQDAETTTAPASQTTQTGKNQPFSIMPPYLAVYVWKRIA